jgi:ribosomal protein S11
LHFQGNGQGRDAAVGEIERVARRDGVRGLEISRRGDRTSKPDAGCRRGLRVAGALLHDR